MVRPLPRVAFLCLLCVLFASASPAFAKRIAPASPSAESSGPGYRFDRGGWKYVHLEGTPEQIGFQHGQLLAAEIADLLNVTKLESLHDTKRDWNFYREASRKMFWPHIEAEYQQELTGIAEGRAIQGRQSSMCGISSRSMAASSCPPIMFPGSTSASTRANAPLIRPDGHCSAFIATGSYTKGGKIVIAHSNWSSYADGERWTVIFDIKPEHGHRMVMDGEPGVITSQDDFGVNDAGLIITETTITQFIGWNPEGIPEFVRSRKAMQYASSIDEYVSIIKEGNNGGYANDWIVGDRKTGRSRIPRVGLEKYTAMAHKRRLLCQL